ncbi:hypothetical protein OVS_01115 [Mycoplasma ovis str. Michigan]|uniref:Uncharacterized protein n=1 Tax=Mycoplasma ovis str. Michigan TaxID=1415773 RepID=A0ABN4BLB8_9MOLU|nr:hypothetical protein OVS_01115 [Mycoplasma ovis str. Michigan]
MENISSLLTIAEIPFSSTSLKESPCISSFSRWFLEFLIVLAKFFQKQN